MKINKKKAKINSAINIFSSNNKFPNDQSIILKNSSIIDNINSKKQEIMIPLTDNRILYKKLCPISHIKKLLINKQNISNKCYEEDSTNNSVLKNNSLKVFYLQGKQDQKGKFYYLKKKKKLNKIKLNDTNKTSKIKTNNNIKKNIYLKMKKKIGEYENEKRYNNQKYNKSCIDFKVNYDSLFIEFFYKWNKYNMNNIIDIKKIINYNYSNLIYNENQIFHYNYKDYIYSKITEFKNGKIQNLENKMLSNFTDVNNKEIKLTLYGIKLTFIPQNKNNKNIILYLPFTFSILFYYKGIDFFKNILLSMIHFDNDNYDKISINYDEVNNYIVNINLDNYDINRDENNKVKFDKNKIIRKKEKQSSFSKKKFGDYYKQSSEDKDYIAIFKKSESSSKVKFGESTKNYKLSKKRDISIHSCSNIYDNIFYNLYNLIWETPNISYKLVLEMPKIKFKYQNIPQNIEAYCHKNMMLFLLKKNFVNWDFYLMNYLFSIKVFRKIILNYFNDKSSLNKLHFDEKKEPDISCDKDFTNKKKYKKYNFDESNFRKIINYNGDDSLKKLNSNIYLDEYFVNKFFPKCDEKKEIFYFFYTNNSNINSLIFIKSYEISVEYEKLNPSLTWKFFFNFKQMKFMNEIKKYEKLELFLPKIIETNFENKNISLDFTVFDDFDPKIFNYDKKEIIIPYNLHEKKINVWRSFRKHKTDMVLKIKNPILIIEKYISETNKLNNCVETTKELENAFLDKLCKEKMSFWPKKLINFINEKSLIDDIKKANDSHKNLRDNIKIRMKKKCITMIFPQKKENKVNNLFS